MDACDEHGAAVFARIFDWARGKSLKINLGTAGCNAYSLVSKKYSQSLCSSLGSDHWGIRSIGAPRKVVDQLRKNAEQTELFARADGFIDLKCTIDRKFEVAEVDALIAW